MVPHNRPVDSDASGPDPDCGSIVETVGFEAPPGAVIRFSRTPAGGR